ncbi:MAG TPA: carboxypeptidase regulatory-like domain-containing protein [Candidatus Angelobacter sp.]|nr:carboxypeptidase regulatory-like domain-containing protein [Candidatus Angelobacter sp.]
MAPGRKTNFSLCLLALLLLTPALGQNPKGALRGTVEDATGARVASARIVMRASESSFERRVNSNSRGEFRVEDVPPGPYRVTVQAVGFAQAVSVIEVPVSSAIDVHVRLNPAPVRETVSVQGQASSITTQPLDASSAVHQAVITARDLETMPLAARSFANIAYLAPGTEPVEPSDPTKARITAVSFGGSSGLNVEASVDGGDNSDDYIGGFLQNFSPDAIQEFAVRTAQEEADTGGTTAGSVVISTKHGTDEWHGSGAFYERAAALNARFPIDNPAPQPKQPFSRQNYIGTLGGPIAKGKFWFFSSLEAVREDASINYSPANLAQFNALAQLAQQGLIPGVSSIPVPANAPVPFRNFLSLVRLDWSQSARSQWFLRAAGDSYTTHNDLVQQATLPSTGAAALSNYFNVLASNQYAFNSAWVGSFIFDASYLHHTEKRNSNLGFALAFPFSSTTSTISGFETFGDNQFVTPITAFPVLRNQEKYQFRYDVTHTAGRHTPRFGMTLIHEPVMSGALPGSAENLTVFALDPIDYLADPQQFSVDRTCTPSGTLTVTSGTTCTSTPAGDGSFSQNVQRLGLYAEDSWKVLPSLTISAGMRWDTTFGLFIASGRDQTHNAALQTLQSLQIPLIPGVPHDYRKAFAPRLGVAYSPGGGASTVIRAGIGLYYNDLAQNGWVEAFQAVNGSAAAGPASLIDPHYHTPYALHITGGAEHAFSRNWTAAADWTHETGMHGYRRYQYQSGFTLFSPLFPPADIAAQQANVPDLTVFRSDNRSRYDSLSVHAQGNVSRRFNLIMNYTLASAKTWGCVLGELFDYVNGVCNPLKPFGPGDYGPSGEDVRHRFVLAGTIHAPGGFQVTLLGQAESARPFTLTTPVDVNGLGDSTNDRAVINGVQTSLDQFRGTPYMQVDMRVSRPFAGRNERWSLMPFIEFFNLFNRSNPGNNYVSDVSALPVNDPANVTALCLNAACTATRTITNPNQLRVPAGALGDFFGPGTTVGIPFAAQAGVRFSF